MFFKVLTLLKLMFSGDIRGSLKALASTKLKVETANRQSNLECWGRNGSLFKVLTLLKRQTVNQATESASFNEVKI